MGQQNAETLSVLEKDPSTSPYRSSYEIISATDRSFTPDRKGEVYNFWQDETHAWGIVRRTPLSSYQTANWETVLDIDALAKTENENWVYKGSDCLGPDYERCMITLSRG